MLSVRSAAQLPLQPYLVAFCSDFVASQITLSSFTHRKSSKPTATYGKPDCSDGMVQAHGHETGGKWSGSMRPSLGIENDLSFIVIKLGVATTR